MKSYLPFLSWIKEYNKKNFSGDLSAGLTVGVMLIPQGMAYSMLAGLPPEYGLYASTIPLIIYALFGTSRQLAVGPVAMVALLIASGVGALAEIGTDEFIGMAILLSLMVGGIQLLMGLLRLGFLVNFLSHPVISGFTSAAAIIIGFSQLKHLFGISIPRGKVHETVMNIVDNVAEINIPTVIIGVSAIVVLVMLRRINKKIPGPLIVVLAGIGAVYLLGMHEMGVKIVKDIPSGFPGLALPEMSWDAMGALIPTALTISLVGFMESIAVAKAIQAKHKNYKVVPNQELIGLGAANIFGSFFQAFPTTGGFSRTAVNDQAGAKTGMAAIISAVLVILTLLFLTDYFYFMPKAILAAIILVAVFGLIDVKEAKHLWATDKTDFTMFMATAVATLALGVEEGIGIGVILSLGMVIYRVSYPHIARLGQIPGTNLYRNVERYDNLIEHEGILVIRLDAQLYFANVEFFKEKLLSSIEARDGVRVVILDAKAVDNIDSTAVHSIHEITEELEQQGIRFILTGVKGPVRDALHRSNLDEELGRENMFLNVHEAVEYVLHNKFPKNSEFVMQANK